MDSVNELVSGLNIANGTRYLSAAGLVCLLYDHALTFSEEVSLIWRAPRSFAKFAFLANRYLVPIALIAVNTGLSGLSGLSFTDEDCLSVLTFSSLTSIVSIGMANLLILLRVLLLWDKERHILILLASVWLVTFCTTVGLMIATVIILAPAVQYNSLAVVCDVTAATPALVAVWASSVYSL